MSREAGDTMGEFDDKARTWDEDPMKLDRARKVARAIGAGIPLHPALRTLEYGCGTGLLGFELRPEVGPLVMADSSPGMLAVLREKLEARGAGTTTVLALDLGVDPLPEARFGLVATLMTLHHVPDVDRILRDFHALLEPGGWLAVADLDLEDGSFHDGAEGVHRGFDRRALGARAGMAGFRDVAFTTVFEVVKGTGGAAKAYPAFLMTARRD
jgi:ubiquinone/menaquinone biosynthesis C-methylase UbiE